MKPVVVVGDGWSALGTVALLASAGIKISWLAGSGARITPPLACLEWGPGVKVLEDLMTQLGISYGELKQGSWVREFRNKSFREPLWTKAPDSDARKEVQKELLWSPEQTFVGPFDIRFSLGMGEIEEEMRKAVLDGRFPHLTRIEGLPIKTIQVEKNQLQSVILGSGEVIECEQLIYADRWSLLLGIEGVPKPLPFLLKRNPMGVLQANFVHDTPIGASVLESFYASVHKEAGEEGERHVWGYFSAQGKRSHWTLCLTAEQVEDNHEIAKKLRRLKSTLDKIFSGNSLIPSGKENFASTVIEEQVCFAEESIFSSGMPPIDALSIPKLVGVSFLTDGYGPSWAFHQIGSVLGVHSNLGMNSKRTNSQAEDMDLAHA